MNPEQDPSSQSTKPGWKTSEAWAGAVAVLAPLLGHLSDVQSVVVGVVAIAYILARAWTKNTVSKGASDVAASRYKP